jgi:hypothetical protein
MKHHRTIVSTVFTLVLTAGLCACAPTAALAGGPLLSGYGGPGAGSQAILGSTLLNGGGSHGGGGSRGGGSQAVGAAAASTSGSASALGTQAGSGAQGAGTGRSGSHSGSASGHGSATHPRAAGATPQSFSSGAVQAASATSTPWFSGPDTLALALAAAVLTLVGLATVRLARTEHR